MKAKLVVLAVIAGLMINVLLVVIPTTKQAAYYRGFEEPEAASFMYGQQDICAGVNYSVERSIHEAGYPFRSAIVTEGNECAGSSTNGNAPELLTGALITVPFYINWFIWSLVSYGILFTFHNILNRKK